MGIKTSEEYLASLKKQTPEVYIGGEKIHDVVNNKYFRISLEEMCKFHDWANDPEKEKDFVFWSPLVEDKVTFWTHLRQTTDEVQRLLEVMKKNNARNFCSMCMITGLNVLWAVTYDIDKARGTKYHERLKTFFRELQTNDFRYCMGVMDPKGDRSLPPSRQADPDLYLRIVEKSKDGIIVNGAKMHTSDAPITHFIFTCPSGVLREADKDYAVSFAVPVDTKGIKFITRPAPGPLAPREMESPVSSHIGFVECLTVFDNVFVPWECVFMCGEWEFTENLISYFSPYVRICKGTCTSARTDILAGAAALISHYNGTDRASHIKSKITDMMISSEIGWGCALASVSKSVMHESGIPIPDTSISNAGLYNSRLKFIEFLGTLQEIAGGIVTTMPAESEYLNEESRAYIDKYLKGRKDVPTKDRLKLLYFIQDLTASRFGGYLTASAICAGGTPETNRVEVFRSYNLLDQIKNVKELCNIK
ncbi:MAG TPA: 4-hydroxyphenylacetate 3-hydroxylase N-terminal domain-containing protein [Syntrophales bacterium]|nr:4-hydroxyphenylacetate 3-hydroxylase N-terminal domain-containing protein [Syntrophales bacterium]